jgi:hypothetical protein
MTRAERIQAKKEAAAAATEAERLRVEAEERRLAAERRAQELGAIGQSTFDQSLLRGLNRAHDPEVLKEMVGDDDVDASLYMYDEEDLDDQEFWDHGVPIPAPFNPLEYTNEEGDYKKSSAATTKKLCETIKEKDAVIELLEIKYMKRALLAHDLRRVIQRKRDQIKQMEKEKQMEKKKEREEAQPSVSMQDDAESDEEDEPVERLSSAVSSRLVMSAPLTDKPCNCPKSMCSSLNCGCQKKGVAYGPACACGGAIDCNCCNRNTYPNTPAGTDTFSRAMTKMTERGRAAMQARRNR